ncbi:MAG: lycopene beta-cyclase CrtY [Myxococcales bacterium]|nr:lycopene beta-cyclase CrtY [Myxococcales bacterium]
MTTRNFDIAVLGGGLQGGLTALAVLGRHPGARVALVEAGPRPGGNHTWCFHAGDLGDDGMALVAPLVAERWDRYDVCFPNRARTLGTAYAAITSDRFADAVESRFAASPGSALLTRTQAVGLDAGSIELEGGRRIHADLVVDARGPERFESGERLAYQKFLGLELELRAPHGLTHPVLMDARVPQTDGFRFFYLLPFGERRVLIEDTYYSDSPRLDVAGLRREVFAHAAARGFQPERVVREETGVLPIPARSMGEPRSELPLPAGYRGGWFHPTTGYSLPPAVRVALHLGRTLGQSPFGPEWARLCSEHARQQRFFAFLNRVLFGAFRPEDRWHVLERFYGLPEATVARFYAMSTTATDRARILCGRPPRGLSVRLALENGVTA